jgi:exonuclease SbcC
MRAGMEMESAIEEEKSASAALAEATALLAERRQEYESCYDRICSQLNILHQIEEQRRELTARRKHLHELEAVVATLDADIVSQSEKRSSLAARVETLENALVALEDDLRSRLLSVEEREALDSLRRRRQDLKRLATSIAEREEAEAKLAESIARQQSELEATMLSERRSLADMTRIQKDADELRMADEALEIEITALREEYQKKKHLLDELLRLEEKLGILQAELDLENGAIERYTEEQSKVTFEIDAAIEAERTAREQHAEVMEERERSRNRLAVESLLHMLKEGEPCPLCGALDHPAPHLPGDADDGRDLDRMLADADRLLRSASEQKAYSSQRMATVQAQLQMSRERIATATTSFEALTREIKSLIDTAGPSIESSDELAPGVESIKSEGQKKAAAQKELRERARTSADELAAITAERNRAATRISALEAGRNAWETQLAEARAWLHQLRAEQERALKGNGAGERTATIESIDAEIALLLEREKSADTLRQRIAAAGLEIKSERDTAEIAERELAATTSRREREEGICEQLRKEIAEITEKLRERHAAVIDDDESGMPIAELIARRERRRDQLRQAHDDAVAADRTASVRVEVAAATIERSRKSFEQEGAELAVAIEAMNTGLAEHRFATAEEAREAMVEPAELSRLRAEATEIAQGLATLQERLRDVTARVDGRTTTREEVDRLELEQAAASRRNDEAAQRTGAAGSELEKCRKGNADFHRVMSESSEAIAKGESAEQLQRYLQGDAFVGYLADERLGDICRRATEQLRLLTNGCYELKTRPSDGFYIIDNGNGGGERAPSSLSGGETFLVSLSLALALSDMVQMGRAPLEFFFLDEGFGTLDSDLLDTVMNSLEQLRSQHRTIGVITHVTALRERISRRLNVHPATESAGSRVEFEVV